MTQWVRGTAGVLLAWLHISQLAHTVVWIAGALSRRPDQGTLQWLIKAEPLDIWQRRALDLTHSSVTRLPTTLHQQGQDLRRCCSTERKRRVDQMISITYLNSFMQIGTFLFLSSRHQNWIPCSAFFPFFCPPSTTPVPPPPEVSRGHHCHMPSCTSFCKGLVLCQLLSVQAYLLL